MDLQRCPKCGDDWRKGAEKCFKCGFVPVGVGLDKYKKKKKRVGKYVEPGSWRGFVTYGGMIGIVVFCGVKRPWDDDWEMVRSLFGQGRHHSVVGEWQIVKTVPIDKSKAILTSQKVHRGTLKFSDKGKVTFTLQSGKRKTDANGSYLVAGTFLTVKQLSAQEGGAVIVPANMNIKLAWTGPNNVVASCNGSEALFLERIDKGTALGNLVQTGLKPGGGGGATPEVQGLADKMTKGVRDADKD